MFYNEVDKILNDLLNESSDKTDQYIANSLNEIKNKLKTDSSGFYNYSKSRFESGKEYVDIFIKEFGTLKSLLKESDDNSSDSYKMGSNISSGIGSGWDWIKGKTEDIKDYVLPKIADKQEYLADLAVENMGSISRNIVGDDFVNGVNEISDSFLYKAVAIFLDPTGVMSWPYLKNATDLYEQHKGTEDEEIYQLNLLAAQISVIPGLRIPLGILTAPFKLVFGGGAGIMTKIFGVSGARRVARSLANKIKEPLKTNPQIAKVSKTLTKPKTNTTLNASKAKGADAIKKLPKTLNKAQATSNATKKTKDLIGKAVKTTAKAASATAKTTGKASKLVGQGTKALTAAGAGDIPKFLEGLSSKDKPAVGSVGSLGRMKSFSGLSTQKF
jgi:hypothetical protein